MRKLLATGILAISVIFAAYGIGSFASIEKLGVTSPFAAASALIQVVLLDADYVEAQDYPHVIVAQPDESLEEYMENEGYTELEDERMGAIRVFATEPGGDFLNYVEYTVNAHYSLWVWRE